MIFSLKDGKHLYQWDRDRVLLVLDEEVDQVHFANDAVTGALTMDVYIDDDNVRVVDIPSVLLQCSCTLTAYAYVIEEGDREYTLSHEEFKVIARKKPDDYIPEEEIDKWRQVRETVLEAAEAAAASEDSAARSATEAKESETAAGNACTGAQDAANEAERHAAAAESSETAALTAAREAEMARAAAETAKNSAEGFKTAAETAKKSAETAAENIETALEGCQNMATKTGEDAMAADESAKSAAASASTATSKADAASTSATNAGNSARLASQSEAQARSHEENAYQYSQDAFNSMDAASAILRRIEQGNYATEEYVQQNGGKIQSVSVNGTAQTIDANKNVNITVPTNVSDLNNDAGFLTKVPSEYVTETELADKGYLTDLPSHTHSQYLTEVPDEYVTEAELAGKGYLTQHQDISGKANASDLNSHTGNTTVHITAAERSKWNAKPDKATTLAGYGITDGATKSEVSQLSEEIVDLAVTPQMYGAKGDGVTDDTTAFENALAENDNVFVPKGKYVITRPLNLTYKKSLSSDDGQTATILYKGTGSVVNIGRLSVFRNINIRFPNEFVGTVFNTHNHLVDSGQSALESDIGHINVYFEVDSSNATLIGITADSGTDPNNMPRLKASCYQTFHDIRVEYGSCTYGYGIKMELIEGRQFTEETKLGFPWITHIDFDDIFLGSPHTAIKAGVTTADGVEHFDRVGMGHILFNNVSTQYRDAESTRIFLDLDNFAGYFTKIIGWDYHPLTWAGEKVNIIGENVRACFENCEMAFGSDFLKCCDFTAETEYTVDDNPEYFMNKYFGGTVLREGYDIIDAKIAAKLSDEYIAGIAEKKIDEVLYSGYSNILEDPLTQIKHKCRWSDSGQTWKDQSTTGEDKKTTVIIPIVQGGNIIRWTPSSISGKSGSYAQMYFFNDDELTSSFTCGSYLDKWDSEGGYLLVDNPSGYKYVSIPFDYNEDINPDTMTLTINREITGDEGKSFVETLRVGVIVPAVEEEVNGKGFLTEIPSEYAKTADHYTKAESDNRYQPKGSYLTEHQDISGKADKSSAETWTFTLADGSTVTKKVVLA